MKKMIWNQLRQHVCFENTQVCIEWGSALNIIKEMGSPEILERNGQVQIVWHNMSLLGGINGDWMVSTFPPNDMRQPFKKIHINYAGDKEAIEAYSSIKTHLVLLIGEPIHVDENKQDKEVKWVESQHYIHLHLFEMHAFRCVLTIGIN